MVEIANFRQLSKLRPAEAAEIRELLEHFGQNRGGRLAREQTGFFLFCFNPLREKVLDQVSDFLFFTSDSLQRKKDELFGFSLLLDHDDSPDETAVFNRLKGLLFLAPREGRVWAGPGLPASLSRQLTVTDESPLAEVLGPPAKSALPPLAVEELLQMTGWIEALKTPLRRQLDLDTDRKAGKVLRLKGQHLTEKYFVLKTVLRQIYGNHDDFPLLFPLEESRDTLSQLLARVSLEVLKEGPAPAEPAWGALLQSRGGGDYPGDSGRDDVVGALTHYLRLLAGRLEGLGLPAVFVFLLPRRYQDEAQGLLEGILGDLVARDGLKLLLLEPQEKGPEFLSRHPSLSWTFPALNLERLTRERDSRGWQDRFPVLSRTVLEACQGRGLSWVHHLWSLQEARLSAEAAEGEDPSWTLLKGLDPSHHKVYFALWAGRGLLTEAEVVPFFQSWGEDPAVIGDKVDSLRDLGFLLGADTPTLRADLGPQVARLLGDEGRSLVSGLGRYLYTVWTKERRLSEVLYNALRGWGLYAEASEVLAWYLTGKINQGQGDFLPLLRRELWESAPTEEWKDRFRLVAASAKLRFALNLPGRDWTATSLDRFRRSFTARTEGSPHGEWELQQGRFYLRIGDLNAGFGFLKKALLVAQDRDNPSLAVRSQSEIGLALLRRHRTEEAREYFEIASRTAEKTSSPYLVALSAGLEALVLFLIGQLSGAAKALVRGHEACEAGGLQQSKVALWFLRGRLDFDQGDYAAAVSALDKGLVTAQRYRFAEAVPVLQAWKARSGAYSGNSRGARSDLLALEPSAERSYFLAETHWFDHQPDEAWKRIMEARTLLPPTQPFGAGEQVSWTSGYAGIEDRALARPGDLGVLENQIEAFQLLLGSKRGDSAEHAAAFHEILARKALLDLDPASAQYYFWHYLMLPKNDSRHDAQRLTLLGRSLKDVQTRSSRIEDPAQRLDYLSRPYWNAQFALEARKLKLL